MTPLFSITQMSQAASQQVVDDMDAGFVRGALDNVQYTIMQYASCKNVEAQSQSAGRLARVTDHRLFTPHMPTQQLLMFHRTKKPSTPCASLSRQCPRAAPTHLVVRLYTRRETGH